VFFAIAGHAPSEAAAPGSAAANAVGHAPNTTAHERRALLAILRVLLVLPAVCHAGVSPIPHPTERPAPTSCFPFPPSLFLLTPSSSYVPALLAAGSCWLPAAGGPAGRWLSNEQWPTSHMQYCHQHCQQRRNGEWHTDIYGTRHTGGLPLAGGCGLQVAGGEAARASGRGRPASWESPPQNPTHGPWFSFSVIAAA
jgi:hypothetical protein